MKENKVDDRLSELFNSFRLMNKMEKYAYDMGVDCAKNGANTTNCHFSIFSNPENTKAWEKGKKDQEEGKIIKVKPLIDGRYDFAKEYCEYEDHSWCNLPKYKRCKHCMYCKNGDKVCSVTAF